MFKVIGSANPTHRPPRSSNKGNVISADDQQNGIKVMGMLYSRKYRHWKQNEHEVNAVWVLQTYTSEPFEPRSQYNQIDPQASVQYIDFR